jgi:hypothetical protein
MFAALALGLVLYGLSLLAAVMSGTWFRQPRTSARPAHVALR